MRGDASAGLRLLRPGSVVSALGIVFLLLLACNIAAIFVLPSPDSKLVRRVALLFSFDSEANVPTLFNFSLLVGLVFLLTHIALQALAAGERWRWHWTGLAAIFLWMSYDEAARMHERLIPLMNKLVDATGVLYFSWVIPGVLFVLVVGIVYIRFVFALPRAVCVLTILGGALYVGGAIGIELIGGDYASHFGMDTPVYLLIATLEESLEMIGLMVFGYGLLRYLALPDRARLERPGGPR